MNATSMLPPTAGDFDIHRMHLVEHISTRTIADKHGISQTRVRQVIKRVCDWLAIALPLKTEAEQEQEIQRAIQGLDLMERRQLALEAADAFTDAEARESFARNLASVRKQRAALVVRLSPQIAGAAVHLDVPSPQRQAASQPMPAEAIGLSDQVA